ncbi:MAG: EFR1 family ferrodoxin [Lachnospiraceae bacterium]|nr:EFR1 family ferrodoxin [Lachnospiraceae bacterium]
MIGIYFSGTGNSRYALELFLKEYDNDSVLFSIEDKNLIEHINSYDEIVFSYPVQYSAVPKILSDFIHSNSLLWKGKKVFIIATMALFSGDGAGVLGRMLKQYGATITGGLHLQMPDSIADEKVLKRSLKKNTQLVKRANRKVVKAVAHIKEGKYPKEGLGLLSRLAGFLSQRLWFGYRTEKYSDKLKIDADKCIGCSKCVKICPTENISMKDSKAIGKDKCTMCYRCVNACPKQAITLLGKTVIAQTSVEKYL